MSYDSCIGYYCGALKKDYEIETIKVRKHNCPLKPMPNKIVAHLIMGGVDEKIQFSYTEGWNDCIDKILGVNNHE